MPINNYEPIYDSNGTWLFDFSDALKKIQEREKYDKIWQEIKKKNNW